MRAREAARKGVKGICQMESREELLENIAYLVSENRRLTADRDLYRNLWYKEASVDVHGMPFVATPAGVPGGAGAGAGNQM